MQRVIPIVLIAVIAATLLAGQAAMADASKNVFNINNTVNCNSGAQAHKLVHASSSSNTLNLNLNVNCASSGGTPGPAGPPGPVGPAGKNGLNGTNGAVGAPGLPGLNGTNGKNGVNATVTIITTNSTGNNTIAQSMQSRANALGNAVHSASGPFTQNSQLFPPATFGMFPVTKHPCRDNGVPTGCATH